MGDRAAAINMYNAAVQAVNDYDNPKRLEHGYNLFSSSCYADPTHWESFYQCGNNGCDLKWWTTGIACYRRALECTSAPKDRAKILSNLSWNLYLTGQVTEALFASKEAVAFDPTLPYAWQNLSCIYQTLDDAQASLDASLEARKHSNGDPMVEAGYAFALLFARQLSKGLQQFECRFEYRLKNYLNFPYPKWDGEENQTLYLVSDQGLGDTLTYARFLREAALRCKYVHAQLHPELMRLFGQEFMGVPNLNLLPAGSPFPPADYWTTFVSLPAAMKLTDAEIRNAKQFSPRIWSGPTNWKVSDRKFHVGIAWAGSPLNDIDQHRSIPVEHFLDLYRVPGIQLYSLQIGPRNDEMYRIGAIPVIRDLAPHVRDVVDTLSILPHLDLIICCESALAHICALVGKECWIPYSFLGRDYRIGLDGNDQLWANHRIFRQFEGQTWKPVFDQITEALKERVYETANADQKTARRSA